jgi:DNA repair protein RecO (recombination protein O)
VARSIIFKKQERGEADELVFFLARDLGWLRGVAKNARKSRVRFGGHLEQFSLVDLVLRPRRSDDLVWIDESQVIRGFLGIRSQLGKVALAAYFLELASLFQAEAHPDPSLFDFLETCLDNLDRYEINPVLSMLDEIRLLGFLGYSPRFDVCPSCGQPLTQGEAGVFSLDLGGACHAECAPGDPSLLVSPDTLALLRRGLQVDGDAASRLRLSRKGQEEVRQLLSAFVRYLRGEWISSLEFLETTGLWQKRGPGKAKRTV